MTRAREIADIFAGGSFVTEENLATELATKRDVSDGYVYKETITYRTPGTFEFKKADYPWLRAISVKVQGAGGGGGGGRYNSTPIMGNGGAGGGYAEKFITDIASLATSETITVGSGGVGAAYNADIAGGDGTDSVAFAVIGRAGRGGRGGSEYIDGASRVHGGKGEGGDINIRGGMSGYKSNGRSKQEIFNNGFGGRSGGPFALEWGKGEHNSTNDNNGPGGGGGGAGTASEGSYPHGGGNGGNGIVIVELYA